MEIRLFQRNRHDPAGMRGLVLAVPAIRLAYKLRRTERLAFSSRSSSWFPPPGPTDLCAAEPSQCSCPAIGHPILRADLQREFRLTGEFSKDKTGTFLTREGIECQRARYPGWRADIMTAKSISRIAISFGRYPCDRRHCLRHPVFSSRTAGRRQSAPTPRLTDAKPPRRIKAGGARRGSIGNGRSGVLARWGVTAATAKQRRRTDIRRRPRRTIGRCRHRRQGGAGCDGGTASQWRATRSRRRRSIRSICHGLPRLPSGTYDLTLRARQPDGKQVTSKQSVAVALEPQATERPVVALMTPDKPTVVLSQPGSAKPGAASAVVVEAVEVDAGGKFHVSGQARPSTR